MPNPTSAPVRLKDIANELNVSVMTVSKVVRGCADVGAETRSRVLAKIKELNYQPNWVARSLAARRTYIIGLIVPDLMHSFFAEIAKGVSGAIRPMGYDVVICNSEEDCDFESSEVDRLLARQVDGLILASAQPPSSLDLFSRIEARGVPLVLIDRQFPSANASYVGADDVAIGRTATRHLIERGCRRIAHIAGPPLTTGVGREAGYREALASAGITVPEANVEHATDERRQCALLRSAASAAFHDRSGQHQHRAPGCRHAVEGDRLQTQASGKDGDHRSHADCAGEYAIGGAQAG
jgi:LacI family transcriptional regulator